MDLRHVRECMLYLPATQTTGVGKTGLSCGLLLKALENGYRCQFVRAQDLFDEMYASLADRSTRQLLRRLARLDVLLIDETPRLWVLGNLWQKRHHGSPRLCRGFVLGRF
jgi:IstB-like ATP binding protein